ncbi:hypothetical protein [Nisaea nitritireducens]|uniref:hypothetical protein n=1 Tax=Nisaea nitritireducens TaxID=568392 RepID=UPI0018669FFC|nr:hypothetical protein [Nisaea nitritireducens]
MAMPVDTKYYSHPDWPKDVAGTNGFRWSQETVLVGELQVSPANAVTASYFLMARDEADKALAFASAVSGDGNSWRVVFSDDTADEDPGPGAVRANSAIVAEITELYVDRLGVDGKDFSGTIALFNGSTSTVKGRISLVNMIDFSNWFRADVIAVTENDGYFTISIRNPSASGTTLPFVAADDLTLGFTRTGDRGDPGTSLSFAWSAENGGGDPGAGSGAANHADLSLATEIYVSDLDALGVDISAEIVALDAITHSPKATVVLRSKATPSTSRRYYLTGVTAGDGFMTLAVVPLSGAGVLAADEEFYLSYSRSGNNGGTGPAGNIGNLTEQAEITELANADWLVVHSASAGGTRRISAANARETLAQHEEDQFLMEAIR